MVVDAVALADHREHGQTRSLALPSSGAFESLDYTDVAPSYDLSRRAEPAIVAALAAGLSNPRTRRVLEIGAGTGNYLLELATRGFRMVGLEWSAAMIERGRQKVRRDWILADALAIPLHDGSIDSAVGVNVLHHLKDAEAALRELRRVVKDGLVIQAVVRENLETLWYRHYFPEIDTILMPLHMTLGATITSMLRAGFKRVVSKPIFYSGNSDLTFESALSRPALLFDSNFRAATSGFRRLSGQSVDAGLKALARDMESGDLIRIASHYDSAHQVVGDCMILCASG
jgi:ubiquinone/menaquinone biosynthesis C-methylase UbiE